MYITKYSWALLRSGTYVCTVVHLNGDDAFTYWWTHCSAFEGWCVCFPSYMLEYNFERFCIHLTNNMLYCILTVMCLHTCVHTVMAFEGWRVHLLMYVLNSMVKANNLQSDSDAVELNEIMHRVKLLKRLTWITLLHWTHLAEKIIKKIKKYKILLAQGFHSPDNSVSVWGCYKTLTVEDSPEPSRFRFYRRELNRKCFHMGESLP